MNHAHRERYASRDSFLYVGVFVLVTWPVVLVLGLIDTFLLRTPDDSLSLINYGAGMAAGAVAVLIIAAIRQRKARIAPPLARPSSSQFMACPNCGYDGPPNADVRGRLVCPMCQHRIAQEATRFRPIQLEAFAGPDPTQNPAEGQWFYSKDGQPLEPASFEKLTQFVVSGKLKPTDVVWKEGMPMWKPIADLPGLFPDAVPKPPRSPGKKSRMPSQKASQSWLYSLSALPQMVSPVQRSSKSVEDEWYYISGADADPHGPVTFAELRQRAARGELRASDLVLGQGSEWKQARFVENLFRGGRE